MNNNTNIFIILLVLFMGFAGTAECGVVIKVRAINPLDEEVPVTIHYPLPGGLTAEDVIGKRLARGSGKGLSEPEDFQINFVEGEKAYFIDHQMTLAPKEIVVLEVEARDVWTVPQKTIDELKNQAESLVKMQPRGEGEEESGPDPVAVKLKEEISRELGQVLQAQKESGITQVGAQGHIKAYQKNREILQQVGMDLTMLRNMTSAPETGTQEQNPSQDSLPLGDSLPSPSETPPSVSQGTPASVVTEAEPPKKSAADKLKSLFKWK